MKIGRKLLNNKTWVLIHRDTKPRQSSEFSELVSVSMKVNYFIKSILIYSSSKTANKRRRLCKKVGYSYQYLDSFFSLHLSLPEDAKTP